MLLALQPGGHVLQPACFHAAESYHVGVLQPCRGRIVVPNVAPPIVQALTRFVAAAAAAEPTSDLPELAQRLVMAQSQQALAATNLAVRQVCLWPIFWIQ